VHKACVDAVRDICTGKRSVSVPVKDKDIKKRPSSVLYRPTHVKHGSGNDMSMFGA